MRLLDELVYRLAEQIDVETLADWRAAFLAEISECATIDPMRLAALTSYFCRALPSGEFVAHLAESEGQIVAISGLVYYWHPPSLANIFGCDAYVMNMYTLPAWRGRGIATTLLRSRIVHARNKNCCRVSLHDLPRARSIYHNLGFAANVTEMRLELRESD